MSQANEDFVRGLYEAFGRADIPVILSSLDEDVAWSAPDNLPHGGVFEGREAVGRFFQGIGESWETLEVEIEDMVSGGERVVVLARARGRLRASGEETGYTAAHAWTVHDGRATVFVEYVNAPLSLPTTGAGTT